MSAILGINGRKISMAGYSEVLPHFGYKILKHLYKQRKGSVEIRKDSREILEKRKVTYI